MLKIREREKKKKQQQIDTIYLSSLGCTAIPVSPNIVSIRVVATVIFSSTKKQLNKNTNKTIKNKNF